MEGIDAVFSSDETFFEEAAMFGNNHKTRRRLFESDNKNNTNQQYRRDNHTRDTNDNDEFDEFEFFDPPSKVCGGEFFSKVMATIGSGSGSKNHSKISHGNNSNGKSKSSSSDKTHRKKKHQQQQQQQHKMQLQLQLQLQQHPKQQQQQQQLQQDDSSSKLIAKLTNKIMKRRKDNYMGTTTTTIEGTKRNSCIKPAIVMPATTTATTMSSLSSLEPSVSSSPWATEVDNNFFHHSSASHQPFFNEKMNHQGETAIMGEITDKHINRLRPPQQQQQQQPPQKPTQQSPRNRTSASLRDLQSLLEEMNNLNGMVRENSTVLQAGIANIALELQQHHTKDIGGKQSKSQSQSPSQPPIPNPPSKASRNNENLDEGDNCQHRFADENSWGIGENNNHVKKVDNKEIEKLKEERLYYRSETETLRSEMECIKEQLSELRKLLPKTKKNSNHDNHPHQQQQPSESPSQQHYPIDDESSVEFPPWSCAYASSSIATSGSSSNISISSAKAGAEDDFASIRNHQYNSHSSDAKMSFRSEIREIINASERSTRSVFERMGVSSDRAEC